MLYLSRMGESFFPGEKIRELAWQGWKKVADELGWRPEILRKEEVVVEHPTDPAHGDYATNVAMQLWGRLKTQSLKLKASNLGFRSPFELAKAIAERVDSLPDAHYMLETVEAAAPGFVNFRLSGKYLLDQALLILHKKEFHKRIREAGGGKRVVIDYSSPNIARRFGVGHLRSTNIGQAIYNLYQFLGWETIGDNHLGDWGTQFGALLRQIKFKVQKEKLKVEELTIDDLERLYVEFHQEAEKEPRLREEAREWFRKLEEGDAEAKRLWQLCVKISLKEFERIYRMLGIKIDYSYGESYYHFESWMKKVLADVKRAGLLKESRGAKVVEIPNEKVPAMLIKSDGATTYLLRDLATIKFRVEKWQPDLIVYEVGVDQKLHLRQVFAVAEMLGYLKREQLVHVAHGMIRWRGGRFSTRRGETIHLEEVIEEGVKRARQLVEKSQTSKKLSGQEKEEIAWAVGIGGLKFNDLKQEPHRDIIFDWDWILSLEGYSAPYLQYTYARCASVLRKGGSGKPRLLLSLQSPSLSGDNHFWFSGLSRDSFPGASAVEDRGKKRGDAVVLFRKDGFDDLNQEEADLLRSFYRFPEVVKEAAENFSPNLLCQYLFDLAQKFNLFYQKHRIIGSGNQEFRLFLTAVVAQILKEGLGILGIKVLEKM